MRSTGHSTSLQFASFYADDIILFATPSRTEGRAIARLLSVFGTASGLQVNLQKCSITPIFGNQEDIEAFQGEFPCQVQQFPIRYLGVPLSTKRLSRACIRPVIEKVAAKLTPWHGKLMNKSGRLIVVKSVASAIPIYTIMANNLPAWAIEEIDSLRRNFLWVGGEQSARGKCTVAWPTVCRPTTLGGLGVSDLKLAGIALQARWLWLQKCDQDRAWSSLGITVSNDVEAFFRISILAVIGDGQKIMFWSDPWLDGASLHYLAPNLLKLVPTRIRNRRTLVQALQDQNWTHDISGDLNEAAIQELEFLWDRALAVQIQEGVDDRFIWKWTTNGKYSARSAYLALHTGATSLYGADLIWKSWAPLKVKMFLWLAFLRRHWTADRRIRHGLQARRTCLLCDQEDESMEHILIRCSYSQQIWWTILQRLGLGALPPGEGSLQDWWLRLRAQLPGGKRKGFDTLFALVTWQLWKERNARVFRDAVSLPAELLQRIKKEGDEWIMAGAKNLGCLFGE